MSKKSLLAALNAAEQVKCTMFGGSAVEDWPGIVVKNLTDGWTLDGDTLRNGTRFIMKPRLDRVRIGTFKSRSTIYTFTWDGQDSRGQVGDLVEQDGALELTMLSGAILRYEVA